MPLASYESARNPERLQASILAALMAGVSTREIKNVQPDPQGTSKSNVSRYWPQVGHKFVEQLRGRELAEFDWAVLMLDGIRLSKDQLAIVAIGRFYCETRRAKVTNTCWTSTLAARKTPKFAEH